MYSANIEKQKNNRKVIIYILSCKILEIEINSKFFKKLLNFSKKKEVIENLINSKGSI